VKLKFKHQKFQEEAAAAVCDVFMGQPNVSSSYLIDKGRFLLDQQSTTNDVSDFIGYNNRKVVISPDQVLENLRRVQNRNQIVPSASLEGEYNLTIEMETGVGKTYTYIKTMFELNKRYGWNKFIVVVPSVAIREGVFASFQLTEEHFAEDYSKKIRFFIYNSQNLTDIEHFASDSGIHVMIINSQAFNARGKDARRIYMKLDSFRTRRPIDVIAATNPILVIDEPQSVEGAVTKEKLKEFNPLVTLRYSATHRLDSIYNMVYRLDALEAYNKRLVKKIAVKGISVVGSTATESYLYLERINLNGSKPPTATLEFEVKGKSGVRKVLRTVDEGFNLHEQSGGLTEYKGYTVSRINALTNTVEFSNGKVINAGDATGEVNEDHIRRIQIRETIKTHFERERQLFAKGIKVLSLFFIDEVAKYRQYDTGGSALNGEYANVFEDEYKLALEDWQKQFGEDGYLEYLNGISAGKTHAGYFSIDKKNHFTDSKVSDRRENTSDDADAYDLIMKDKARLLDFNEPVRFIFSHSALREGWDNPNVFQICTLKQSGSDFRKRQEVGRGLRLCVNAYGDRMDVNALGGDVHQVNVLTVIANESYDVFAARLQQEIAEVIADRPREITVELFENLTLKDADGKNQIVVDHALATKITNRLIREGYIDDDNHLTEKYYEEERLGQLRIAEGIEDLQPYKDTIVKVLNSTYNPNAYGIDNARNKNISQNPINQKRMGMKEFQALWSQINARSAYTVAFENDELVRKSISALDTHLQVSQIYYKIEKGEMTNIKSKEALERGEGFKKDLSVTSKIDAAVNSSVKYDLVGKLATETALTRKTIVEILKGISPSTFAQFGKNPEEFIIKAGEIIRDQKASVIVQHIRYNRLDDAYSTAIFTDNKESGQLGKNAIQLNKHLYEYLVYDSKTECDFAKELDACEDVAVYTKLPKAFSIRTPVGEYSPDWAIAFNQGKVKHVYFVAETKGDLSTLQFREVESLKIHCAREHFKAISSDKVKYDVVNSYKDLIDRVFK
jgi:type III restriction enzyme